MKGRGILLAVLSAGTLALVWWWRSAGPSSAPGAEPDPAAAALPREVQVGPRPGRWRPAPMPDEVARAIAALNGVGYAGGVELAPDSSGVTRHVRERAFAGTNFYNSGHASTAVLMDMDGKVLHTWHADAREVWPEEPTSASLQFWRRAFLRENGDVLAIWEGHSLIKLDRHSNLLWKSRCSAHHDLEVLANGDILVLTRKAHVVPTFDAERPVLEDFVTLLDANGKEKKSFSLLAALQRSDYPALERHMRNRFGQGRDPLAQNGDLMHTNSLAVLDGQLAAQVPAFRAGNLLVSSRPLSFIAVVDPEREEFVWTLSGAFREQHDPRFLANGNLLLFDNTGRGGFSSVRELDPVSGATRWEYHGTPQAPFFSRTCGTAQRLPNGNTLITESDGGRAFEVTSAGEIVWEFWNPERAGDRREFIATLLEMVRLAPDQALDWLH